MSFITSAYAQATTAAADPAAAGTPNILLTVAPLILVFFVFYVMVIRPQNKRLLEQRAAINGLKKGDKVITSGGLYATVKSLSGDNEITLEIADGVIVTAVRHTITSIRK